jgi:hypothetical protein
MTTIVSSYYLLPGNKKRPIESYMAWISIFLRYCDSPIVMFSDGEIADSMDTFRRNLSEKHSKGWKLVRRPLSELYCGSEGELSYFKKMAEGNTFTSDVVRIWMNKGFLLKEVTEDNPFSTESFIWCDAGCWRNPEFAARYGPGWPRKISSLTMSWLDDSLQKIRNMGKAPVDLNDFIDFYRPMIMYKPSVAGGIFGGNRDIIAKFTEIFKKILDIHVERSLPLDGDQELCCIAALWLEARGHPVDAYDGCMPLPPGTDNWFMFQSVLSNTE